MSRRISVIVPTLNEGAQLATTLGCIDRNDVLEIIVADGESQDETIALARELADQVVTAPPGRASQLNVGALQARGETLLFLHADSHLAPGWGDAIEQALGDSEVVGGAFAVQVGEGRGGLRLISWGINLRSRLLRMPYGDQGLFVRRHVFEQFGGFSPMPIMEDIDFIRRLRRLGKLAIVRPAIRTSDRRWRANGILRTTCVNLIAVALYRLGVGPERIKRSYDALLGNGAVRNVQAKARTKTP